MRAIDAGDLQRFVAASMAEGLDPKTIRNHWGTVSLIWNAALAQKYVDALLPETEVAPQTKKESEVLYHCRCCENHRGIIGRSIASSIWLTAESGLRAGELAGLKLPDIDGEKLTVNHSVWLGKEQAPKTNNSIRSLALSPQLMSLLWEQIARQRARGTSTCSTASTGSPIDMNVHRRRKMTVLLSSLEIPQAGYHAFRHFNVAMLDALRVPLKTIQERIGHALTGSFTLDVYGGQPEWGRNLEAASACSARSLRKPSTKQ